jgi:hypothetical protein
MKRFLKMSVIFLLATIGMNAPVQAQQGDWKFNAALYLWATDLSGSSTIGSATVPIEIAFTDAAQSLDSAFTFHFEMQNDRWGWFADINHISLNPGGTLPLPNDPTLAIGMTNNVFELAGTYRFPSAESLEVLGGARYTKFKLDLAIGENIAATVVDDNWVDAFLGLRYTGRFSEKFAVILRGDVGAGGSNLVWNAVGSLNYSFNSLFSVLVGYRWMDYDYETGEGADFFAYDIGFEGPVIAAAFSW